MAISMGFATPAIAVLFFLTSGFFSLSRWFGSMWLGLLACSSVLTIANYGCLLTWNHVLRRYCSRTAAGCAALFCWALLCWFGLIGAFVAWTMEDLDVPMHKPPLQRTLRALRPQDVLLIGNGPLSIRQRALIRQAREQQIFRFNGLSNLHPDEAVGTVYARRSQPVLSAMRARDATPWLFWGIPPPFQIHTLPFNIFPFDIFYACCWRLREAQSIKLLEARPEDAEWYARREAKRVEAVPCRGLCRHPPADSAMGWSSGFMALVHMIQVRHAVPHVPRPQPAHGRHAPAR